MAVRVDMLRAYLRQTLDRSISQGDLTRFVQLARIVAATYLATFRASAVVLCEKLGISSTDLAYDCVADLFARDEKGLFVHLEGLIGSLHQPLDQTPDHELFAAFRALLSRFADTQLGRLYAQADPQGARIHRNIRECIKKEGAFQLTRDFRGWVITPIGSPDLDHLPPCSMDWLKSEFFVRCKGTQQIPRLLALLHDLLMSLTEFRRSIPLMDVVQLIKDLYQSKEQPGSETQEDQSLGGMTQFEIAHLREQVEQTLKEKILVTYVVHGKVDRKQAKAMYLACRDLLGDWCSGDGANFSLYEYLARYLPIDEQSYKDGLRVKMEYLVKIAREEFANRLTREL